MEAGRGVMLIAVWYLVRSTAKKNVLGTLYEVAFLFEEDIQPWCKYDTVHLVAI